MLLCLVAAVAGANNSLFPATMKALEEDLGLMPMSIGCLGMAQALSTALCGPFWGIIASRSVLSRKSILIFGCFAQGLLLILIAQETLLPAMIFFRSLNGMALASLRPISGSIIADIFP